jgi:hypothetical protein
MSRRSDPPETGRNAALLQVALRKTYANVSLFLCWLLRDFESCSRLSCIRLTSYRDRPQRIVSVPNGVALGAASQNRRYLPFHAA